ncbi:MAG: hypothetical protein E4H01_17060 [Lysobacterales bacterium]|nr:MAG: hypothetical protein E4H01_17060 [Xanthomonadales bacterium]
MKVDRNRMLVFIVSMIGVFVLLRVSLQLSPNSNFNVADYNIHHLFIGLILIMMGGVPLAIAHLGKRLGLLVTSIFGLGLGIALDEWVYLITTDGSDESYLLPISFWGGVVAIAVASGYAVLLGFVGRR